MKRVRDRVLGKDGYTKEDEEEFGRLRTIYNSLNKILNESSTILNVEDDLVDKNKETSLRLRQIRKEVIDGKILPDVYVGEMKKMKDERMVPDLE